jgi:drug/metabolite transporter (DMT)-like permease
MAGHLEPAVILSYALGFGSLLLVLAALPTFYTLVGLSSRSYALLFMLAVVHTALAFGLYTVGLKRLDAGQAAIVATVEPVVAGAIGVVLLGEKLTALKVIGALLVLAGAALAQVSLEKASREGTVPREPSHSR